jgi:thiol-disulfide isomerase/thioredoxin
MKGLAGRRGKVAVIYFWASWCAPCQETMAEMQTYREKHRIGATWSLSLPLFSWSLSLRRAQSPRVGSQSVPVTECGGQKVNVSFSDFGTGGSNQLRDPRLSSAGNERLRATGLIAFLFLQKLVRLRTSAHSIRQSLSLFALLLFRPD